MKASYTQLEDKLRALIPFLEDQDDGMPGYAEACGNHAAEIRDLLGMPDKYGNPHGSSILDRLRPKT